MGRTQLWMLPNQLWMNLNIYLASDNVIEEKLHDQQISPGQITVF